MKSKLLDKLDIVALLVRLGGLLAIFSIPLKSLPDKYLDWLPFDPSRTTHVAEFIAGLLLLYLASQLHRKKHSALLATGGLLVLLILLESIHVRHPHLRLTAFFSLILFVLVVQRNRYVVRSDLTSLRRSLLLAVGLLVAVAGFVTISFARIDQKEFGRTLTTSQTLSLTAGAVAGKPLPPGMSSRRARDQIFGLQTALAISGTIAVLGLFYPIRMRRGTNRANKLRAENIVRGSSTSSEDYFKLWPADKHYYFYNNSFVAYGVSNGVAVVLFGATGDTRYFKSLRQNFTNECHLNGWTIAVLHADETERQAWEQLGLRATYIGSEARVSLTDFYSDKVRDKHFRYVRNRAEKDGLSVIELPHPLSAEHVAGLRAVSDAWIASGRHEYRFIMGYFDPSYLEQCRIFAAIQSGKQAGKIVAYTNLLPQFQAADQSIDHMRYIPDLSSSTMHYLLLNVMLALESSDATTVNLGLAPLSKLEDNVSSWFQPILGSLKTLSSRYYSFSGLEQFKGKFGPAWEPIYLLYEGLPTRLPAIGAAVLGLSSFQRRFKGRPYSRYLLLVSIVSGLCYASFPLAASLNPAHAWNNMVSVLGQVGQPYAAVFNGLDSVASLLAIFVAACLLRVQREVPQLLRLAMYAVIFSNIGDVLSAIFELPAGLHVDGRLTLRLLENPAVLAHGAASLMNSGGFITAMLCWAVWVYRSRGLNWRHLVAGLILGLGTIGFWVGQTYPQLAPSIQRVFILSYAVWFTLFCYDVLHVRKPAVSGRTAIRSH